MRGEAGDDGILIPAKARHEEDVRFRELFERLPQRAATGDEALAQVLELAAHAPRTDI